MLDSPEPPKSILQKLQERAAASRFFTVSVLLHVVLIVMGGSVVLFKSMSDPPDFTSSDGLVSSDVPVEAPPEPTPDVQQLAPQTPSLTAPSIAAITSTASAPTFTVASVAPIIKPQQTDPLAGKMDHAPRGPAGTVNGAFARRGGMQRAAAIAEKGGKKRAKRRCCGA